MYMYIYIYMYVYIDISLLLDRGKEDPVELDSSPTSRHDLGGVA